MPSRVERILESIRTNAGDDVYERIKETCEESDIKAIISELENTCGAEGVTRVMKPCGQQCIPQSFIKRAKAFFAES